MRNSAALGLFALSLGGQVCWSDTAHAFCRTTTCDPNNPSAPNACQYENGCPSNGAPLAWPQACVAFSTQKDGSPLRHISFDTMRSVVEDSYYKWGHVDCGNGQPPSIQMFDRSPVNCDEVQYNKDPDGLNANIWMFRDQQWPHAGGGTLALTTVTYSPENGDIYDADVEINSAENEITVGDTDIQFDLKSIVTHESGHTLGLAHSTVLYATMYSEYSPQDVKLRTLSDDDIAGICTIYPPGRVAGTCDPTPRHGFSTECNAKVSHGCSLAGPPVPSRLWGVAWLGGGVLGVLVGMRRRRRM